MLFFSSLFFFFFLVGAMVQGFLFASCMIIYMTWSESDPLLSHGMLHPWLRVRTYRILEPQYVKWKHTMNESQCDPRITVRLKFKKKKVFCWTQMGEKFFIVDSLFPSCYEGTLTSLNGSNYIHNFKAIFTISLKG